MAELENYRLPETAEASIVGCVLLCPDTKPAVSRLVSERGLFVYALWSYVLGGNRAGRSGQHDIP